MSERVAIDHAKNPERVFLDAARRVRGGEPTWLAARRDEGKTLFAARGLPSKRVEAWKYSDLRRIVADADLSVHAQTGSPFEVADALTLKIVDGCVAEPPRGLPAGLRVVSLRDELLRAPEALAAVLGRVNTQQDHAVAGLNMALWEDGVVVTVAREAQIAQPLHLAFDWQGNGAPFDGRHLRLLILLETGAALTLVESHVGGAPQAPLTTLVAEMRLAPGAQLHHLRVERLSGAARQTSVLLGELARDARYDGASVSEGAAFARRETRLRLDGPGARAQLNGVQLLGKARQSDDTVVITHAAPRCTSRQAFRAVAGDGARGVVQGRVEVNEGAAGTDARQSIKGMLLSRRAEIDAKPELEILADDVACAHGTAIGELDAAALFYLRARGIPEEEARALLIEAFLSVAFDDVANERLKALAEAAVADWATREPAR